MWTKEGIDLGDIEGTVRCVVVLGSELDVAEKLSSRGHC